MVVTDKRTNQKRRLLSCKVQMKLQGFNFVFITSCLFFLSYFSSSSSIPLTSQGLTLPYMTSNPDEISGKSFDYIVIGGGACGCPLVATLSEKFSVLLIERGGGSPYNNPLVLESKNYGLLLAETDEFSSIAQSFVSEEGVPNARGRILGGSTAINSGFYSRASDEFVETVGWDKDLVRDAYEWVEDKMVFKPSELSKWQSVVKDGLVEGGGLAFNGFSLEHIPGTKVSGSIFDGSGIRHSAADLLGYGNLKRITVLLNATVKNVAFHSAGEGRKPKVSGVRFIRSDGDGSEVYEAYLKQPKGTKLAGDVILSAGTLGSPQILMLSGIGPRKHLRQFNITPIINAAEVGKGIKDNPGYSLLLDSPDNRTPDLPKVVGITDDFKVIIESQTSYVSQNETRWIIGAKMTFPISKGELELRNTDPRQNPSVRFNYLTEKRDLDQCVKMAHLLEKVTLSNALKPYLGNDQNPELSTAEELRKSCKLNLNTFYHNHGGCGVGSVVSKNYRVYGVEGLRVVDGSTLPDSPGTNPMATLLMLGRYQGIKILQEREDISLTYLPEYGDHLRQWVSIIKARFKQL